MIALLHTPPKNKWEINCSYTLFLSFLSTFSCVLSLSAWNSCYFFDLSSCISSFFLLKKINRSRQKTPNARSGRETRTQDSIGQSRNLHQFRLREGKAEIIRFCVDLYNEYKYSVFTYGLSNLIFQNYNARGHSCSGPTEIGAACNSFFSKLKQVSSKQNIIWTCCATWCQVFFQ